MTALDRLPGLLPEGVGPFLEAARGQGFTPVLVGGAIRDLFQGVGPITDWDFELHHPSEGAIGAWDRLLNALAPLYRLQHQSHHVVKAQTPARGAEFEFAPPRVETYPAREVYAHSDVEAKVVFGLSYAEACRRRDFTLNAMGAAWDGQRWELWDPLDGEWALEHGQLRPCSLEHFPKDPVRFLRAHRFALRGNLRFSPELADLLEQMDVSCLTSHYVAEEAYKSGRPFELWNRLQEAPSLAPKFQGGVAGTESMQACYTRYLPQLGFSNALLAAVFAENEGWHLLQPLAGKGEKETSLWRERRELIRELRGRTPEDLAVAGDAVFTDLCQLVKTPLQWQHSPWVREVLDAQGLGWLPDRPWPELDLRPFPPPERHTRKVRAWLGEAP